MWIMSDRFLRGHGIGGVLDIIFHYAVYLQGVQLDIFIDHAALKYIVMARTTITYKIFDGYTAF